MALNDNERRQLAIVAHQVGIERFSDGLTKRLSRLLTSALRDIDQQLAALGEDQVSRRRRLEDVRQGLARISAAAYQRLGRSLDDELMGVAALSADFARQTMGSAVLARFSYSLPSEAELRAILNDVKMVGKTLPRELTAAERSLFRSIEGSVQLGVLRGESIPAIVKRVRQGPVALGRAQAASLVRTAVSHVSARAEARAYREFADIIDFEEWLSTLDSRTTDICRGLDKKPFPVGKGPYPPAHYRCRSRRVAVTKSWKELGIQGFGDYTPKQRASMFGPVRGDLDFGQWLRDEEGRHAGLAAQILGPERAKIFLRNPQMAMSDLMKSTYEPLTLDELRALDQTILQATGLASALNELSVGDYLTGQRLRSTLGPLTVDDLEDIERQIEHERTEIIATFDEDGRITDVLRLSRTGGEVPAPVRSRSRGGTLTHNHPRGSSFSMADITYAASKDLQEVRAVGTNALGERHLFSARPGPNGWPGLSDLDSAVRRVTIDVLRELDEQVASGEITQAKADAEGWHLVWERVAKELGFRYERTP